MAHNCDVPLRATSDMVKVDKRGWSEVCMSANSVSQEIGTYLATHCKMIMIHRSHNRGRMKECGGRPMIGPSLVGNVLTTEHS